MAESKLGAEALYYLLFNILQGAHHSSITLEKVGIEKEFGNICH